MSDQEITVATVNIAGAKRMEGTNLEKFKFIANKLINYTPDIIGLQEVIRVPEAGRDDLESLQTELGGEWDAFFFPHLDSFIHSHPKKWTSNIFKDYYFSGQRIFQGTGILVRRQNNRNGELISIINLWDSQRNGQDEVPGVIMPHPNTIYCGDRDTEPRALMMIRFKIGGVKALFCCTHLSTFTTEDQELHGNEDIVKIRKPTVESIRTRERQTKWMVDYLKSYQKELGQVEPIIIAGDFNSEPDSRELQPLRKFGLVHAHLGSPKDWRIRAGWSQSPEPPYTHRKRWRFNKERRILIDHIFFTQAHFTVKEAYIINLDQEGIPAEAISDHNPVIVRLAYQ